MEKVKKDEDKKKESISFDNKERKKMIQDQLENALKERDAYTTLVLKCQGALELLSDMEKENNND